MSTEYKKASGFTYKDGGREISADASARQLFDELFWDPCSLPSDPVSQAINVVLDDLEVIRDAFDSSDPDTEVIQRIVMRACSKLRIAQHLAKKYDEADKEDQVKPVPEERSGKTGLFAVPFDDDGEPDFENAFEPDTKVMAEFGWVSRANASTAIHILMTGARSAATLAELTLMRDVETKDEAVGVAEDEKANETPRPSGVYAPDTEKSANVAKAGGE